MCEAKAYIKQNDKLELLMEDVVNVVPENDKVILTDILGKTKEVEGKILQVGLLDHKIILKANPKS